LSGNFQVRQADPVRDNAALCALARRCPQGKHFRFHHHRDQFDARGQFQLRTTTLLIESSAAVVATLSTADKSLWIGSCKRAALYLYDLMVDPAYRKKGLAQLLFKEMNENCGMANFPALRYGYIVSDNVASRQLMEQLGYQAAPAPLRMHVVLPGRQRCEPPPDFQLVEPFATALAQPIENHLRAHYEGVDTLAGQEALALLSWQGTRAWGMVRRLGLEVIDAVPWFFRLAGVFSSLIPRPGQTVRAWSLHYLGAIGPRQQPALEMLVRSVAWLASEAGCDALLLPSFANDPTGRLVRRLTLDAWGLAAPCTHLYVGGDEASALLAAKRPLLLSGSDA
jgi:GNAT superfamily N-acetyltransferase